MRFSRVKSLRGELKRSEIRRGVRYQLTTEEFVMQRGQQTYRIALSDILGFFECDENEFRSHIHRLGTFSPSEVNRAYKIVATMVHSVTPVGVVEQTRVSFYTRLSSPFASQMERLLGTSG